MLEKCVLALTGAEAKEACGMEQLYGGLEAGIEGGIHTVRLLWEHHAQEENWGFLLIDTHNAFNEDNRTSMMCAVQLDWPSGGRFAFNCYRHWSTLVISAGDGMGHFLYIKEEVAQGDPLEMVAHGLGPPPPPSYRTYVCPTPASLSHDMLMTLGQEAHSRTYNTTLTILWCKGPQEDISWIQPRAS